MKKDETLHRLLERTSRPRAGVRPQGACLDAETVAAWTDGSLTPVERSAAETHAADCDRCLAVLAATASTAPPASAIQRPSWLSVRWLAPLTAAAVAITAWVIVQEPTQVLPPAAPPAAVDALKPAGAAAQAEREAPAENRAEAVEKKTEPPPAPTVLKDQVEARRATKSAAADAAAPTPQTGKLAQPPAAPAAPAPPPPPPARAEAQQERLRSSTRDALASTSVIVSPDPNVRWRLLGTTVERSTDGGRTWQAQPTGTALEPLAGTAPAPDVCWLVGRSGLVLLSTDGETWRRLPFPDGTIDLVGVTANDAMSATVTAAGGRTYRTTDGGKTWVLQENPAAPF